MKHNNYLFLTEREALEFIHSEFGENAALKDSSINSDARLDNDGLPFSWSGEIAAYLVNDDVTVGYYESLEDRYTVTLGGIKIEVESLWEARETVKPMLIDLAEEINFAGILTIHNQAGELIDETEVELWDDEEPTADEAAFQKVYRRYEIGKTIREARQQACLSIRELAAKAGVSKNNIQRIEDGRYGVTVDILAQIANVLNLKLTLTKI